MDNASLVPGQDQYSRWSINVKPHWTPAYLWNRFQEYLFRKKNPNSPWLTRDAIKVISSLIKSSDSVLEFGSGRSTVWFAERVAKITSVESNGDWYKAVEEMLKPYATKTNYIFIKETTGWLQEYRQVIDKLPAQSFDLCLVDGGPRALCALHSLSKIRSGGYLVIDNVNWFIPSDTKTPSSRKRIDGVNPDFSELDQQLKSWRVIWTSDGVTDTAIYIKP